MLEFIDGDLCLLDEDGEVTHVFERGDLSRAAYKHMTHWIENNFEKEKSFKKIWEEAEASWDALSPEMQGHLFIMSRGEEQCLEDIRTGLLATLAEYRGLNFIKEIFADAIRCVKI